MSAQDKDIILAHRIAREAAERPGLDVVTFVDITPEGQFAEEVRTYCDLWDNGRRIAGALDAEGMGANEAFGLIMQNHPEFVDAMVGSSIAGTVFVPIDPRTKGKKLVYMLDFAECRGAIVADYALSHLIEALPELPRLEWVWVLGDSMPEAALPRRRSVADILAAPVPEMELRVDDPATPMQMLYTSGTTGDPKAILSPYERLSVAQMLPQILGLNQDDRLYTGLSLTHANAQLLTLGTWRYNGMRCVISRKFTKSRLWDITRQYGCSVFNLLGGMTTALYSEPERPDDLDNPVRLVLSAGMPAAIWDRFRGRFGVDIYEFYGAAEGGLTFNPPGVGPVGSIGKAPPNLELRIVDENDRDCAPGEPGEIIFRNADGSTPAVTYFKNPEASENKTRSGWLRMGDIGRMDEDGWVYFLYRAGGGIRRNGDFVNPAFVEKEIAELDTVDDVFVYGVATPDNAPGEKEVVAAIVAKQGSSFDPAAVFAACRRTLEANFVPRFIQLVDEIPKTASEKPQERYLLEAFSPDAANIFTERR